MGILGLFKRADIRERIKAYQATPGTFLLDVRTPEEYRGGHIPGSVNVPLQDIDKVSAVVADKTAPLFICCQSGARSRVATRTLRRMGYESVVDIGGVSAYPGPLER